MLPLVLARCGRLCLVRRKGEVTLRQYMRSNSARSWSLTVPRLAKPALAKRESRRPKWATVSATADSLSAAMVRSLGTTWTERKDKMNALLLVVKESDCYFCKHILHQFTKTKRAWL